MRELFDVYATQVRLLWQWRGGPVALVKRGVLTFLVATVSFGITAAIVPGIEVSSIGAAALAVIFIGVFNALVRPVLLAVVAPWSLIAMGIVVIILQIVSFFVVALLGGRIWATPRDGGGSEFGFALPLAEDRLD